ncbi:hypothetical protein Tco_0471898 [Tanacetum coccineum]
MIGSLMYLTSSRPDIMFSVCACSRFQVQPKVSHMNTVKRIFRYLKDQPKLGLWYPKDSPLILEAFSDSDYAGASLDRKSTTGGCQFISSRLISWQCKKQTVVAKSTTEAKDIAASHYCGRRGRDTKITQSGGPPIKVGDEAVHIELDDKMERAATTASRFEAEQDSGSGPRCQETTLGRGDCSPWPHDSPLLGGHTPGSDEGKLKHTKLIELATKLTDRIAAVEKDLQQTKKTYNTALQNNDHVLEEQADTSKVTSKNENMKKLVQYLKSMGSKHTLYYDSEDKEKGTKKKFGGTRKKTLARKRAGEKKSKESSKRQKNEDVAADYEQEKAKLRLWLKVTQDDEESVNS